MHSAVQKLVVQFRM